ncbi:DUF3500 domain-containing protein [Rothia sp. ARF10]|nr:DUF3500 domain-containing protein [Rothia sp. ARF10]
MTDPAFDDTPSELVQAIEGAARSLLTYLSPDQRATAMTGLDDPSWTRWSYLPGERPGLSLEDATPELVERVSALVAASHSPHGASILRGAVEVERERRFLVTGEVPSGDRYWLRIHGEPGVDAPWAWRLNGHHVGVHVVVDGSRVTVTPHFVGSEPARVSHGVVAGHRLLGPEEDLARDLLAALRPAQRDRAVASGVAFADILSGMDAVVDPRVLPRGIRRDELDRGQQVALDTLVRRYLDRLPTAYADDCWEQTLDVAGDSMEFVWAGSTEVGAPHYYAVTSPLLLVEYDNTQDGANHAHSVVRHLRDDFGGDSLRRHRRDAHA